MKKILFVIAFLPLTVLSQKGKFIIKGKIDHLNSPTKIFLFYSNSIKDSAVFANGKFKFRGKIDKQQKAILSVRQTNRVADIEIFFLQKGRIKVTSNDFIRHADIKGGKMNKDLQKLNVTLAPLNDRLYDLQAEYAAAPDEQKKSAGFKAMIREKRDSINKEMREAKKKFIGNNPGSMLSLNVLGEYAGVQIDVAEIEPMFQSLSAKVRNSKAGMEFSEEIEKVKKTTVGALAPEFTQNDPDGHPVSLTSFRGKYVLIDFWASWCVPCRAENPNVVKAYHAYKDRNFTILSVSLDKPGTKEKWLKAISDDKLEWTQVSDLKFWNNEVAVQYGIYFIPQNFLVGPDGKILAKNLTGEELEKTLEQVLAK